MGIFAVPSEYDTLLLFYNADLLQEAGIPLPTASWHWDKEFLDAARRATRDSGGPEDRHRDHGLAVGLVLYVAPPLQRGGDRGVAVGDLAEGWPRIVGGDRSAAGVEEVGREAGRGRAGDDVGRDAAGGADLIGEVGRAADRQFGGAIGEHLLAGVGDEEVDDAGRDQAQGGERGAEPEPHADPRPRRSGLGFVTEAERHLSSS